MTQFPILISDSLSNSDNVYTAWDKFNSNMEILRTSLPAFSPDLLVIEQCPDDLMSIYTKINYNMALLVDILSVFTPFYIDTGPLNIDCGLAIDTPSETIDCGLVGGAPVGIGYDCGAVLRENVTTGGYVQRDSLLKVIQKINNNLMMLTSIYGTDHVFDGGTMEDTALSYIDCGMVEDSTLSIFDAGTF